MPVNEPQRPIHVAVINRATVRFFRAPGADPHLPWHAVDDLYAAMALPPRIKARMLARTLAFPGAGITRVFTVDGQVVIASHSQAQWLIGAAVEAKGVTQAFERDYLRASAEATNALSGDLSAADSLMMTIMAARNTLRDGS